MRRSVHMLLRCARALVHRLRCGYCSRLAGGDSDSSACHEIITPENPQERRLNTGSNPVSTVSSVGVIPLSRGQWLTLMTAILFINRRINNAPVRGHFLRFLSAYTGHQSQSRSDKMGVAEFAISKTKPCDHQHSKRSTAPPTFREIQLNVIVARQYSCPHINVVLTRLYGHS